MQFFEAFLLTLALGGSLRFAVSQAPAQYDDDNTPYKIQLEDLESEHADHKQQTQQQVATPATPAAPQQQQQQHKPLQLSRPLFTPTQSTQHAPKEVNKSAKQQFPIKSHFTPVHRSPPAPRPIGVDYETAQAHRSPPPPRQQAADYETAQAQRSPPPPPPRLQGIDYETAPAHRYTFAILPFAYNGLSAEDSSDDDPDNLHRPQQQDMDTSDERHQLSHGYAHAANQPPPPPQPPQLIVTYAPNEATLQHASGGVQYLTSNQLPEAPTAYESAHHPPRPRLLYAVPTPVDYRPPSAGQSKQLAYAPSRSESGTLASGAATIPFPPSFVSITSTHRPATYNVMAPLKSHTLARTFRPSQVLPMPDLFWQRQHKSLLDSYIPSWVVTKMLQPHQGSHFQYNNLAYVGGGGGGSSSSSYNHPRQTSAGPQPDYLKTGVLTEQQLQYLNAVKEREQL